jgi:O-antigen/teichoic acid export membrane protein
MLIISSILLPKRKLTFSAHRLLSQTFLVGMGGLAITACTLLVTRIYTHRYGALDVSAFLMFRLYGSLLLACTALGIPIALQRTVAYLGSNPSRAAAAALSGLIIAGTSLAVGCSLSVMFAGSIAEVLDHPGATSLWRAFMLLTYAQALATLVSFIQLAREYVLESVMTSVGALGLSPLVCVWLLPDVDLPTVIVWTSVITGAATLPSLVRIGCWSLAQRETRPLREARGLLRYGLPRMPASALEVALDLVLPWMAVLSGAGLIGAGFFAVGLALMRPLNPISGALSQVLIPASASAVARGDVAAHTARVHLVAQWALHGGTFATFQMIIWADVLIWLWLGPDFSSAAGVAAIVCLSLAPSFLFACLRGLIDGETEKAVNTRNLCAAILVFGVVSWLLGWLQLGGAAALGLAYLASRIALAILTFRYVARAHRISFVGLRPWTALACGAALGIGAVALRRLLPAHYGVVEMVTYVPLAALIFTAIMTAAGMEWTRPLRRRLLTI